MKKENNHGSLENRLEKVRKYASKILEEISEFGVNIYIAGSLVTNIVYQNTKKKYYDIRSIEYEIYADDPFIKIIRKKRD